LTTTAQWATLGTTLATVSNSAPTHGLVTGWYPGTAVISASSGSVSNSAQLTVTGATVASLAVTPATAILGYLNQQQFTATATFSDGTTQNVTNSPPVPAGSFTPIGVAWTLGEVPFIASNSGLLIGESLGTSEMVTATFTQAPNTAGQGISASASATATSTVDLSNLVSVSILPAAPTIANNTEVQFSALGTFNDGSTRDVTSLVTSWSSSNYSVAADDGPEPNVFTAAATGVQLPATASITVNISGFSAITPAMLTVSDATLQAIALSPANASLAPTTKLSYTATGTFSDMSTQDLTSLVKWTVQDGTGEATVNQGQLTGSSAGSITVTATSSSKLGSIPGSTAATVTSATLQSIAVTPAPAFIAPGATITFSAIGTFSDGSTQDVSALATWTSESSTVATVAGPKSASVTGQGVGQSIVTAKWGGMSATGSLAVALPSQISIAVTPATVPVAVGASTQLTATGTFIDGTTQDFTSLVNWSSSNATAATVGYQTGLVSGLASGTSTITATLGSVTSTAQVTVQ
jgi:trimeric autotransporter adhesin